MAEPKSVVSGLGSRIRAERELRGMSISDLSARSEVGRSAISAVEQSTRTPTLETLSKIAQALDVSMVSLLDDRVTTRPVDALGNDDPTDSTVLGVWNEHDDQVEVHRLRVTAPIRRSRSRPGTRGYLTVLSGTLNAGSAATPRKLTAGSQLAFAADQPHLYAPVGGPAEVVLVMRYPGNTSD